MTHLVNADRDHAVIAGARHASLDIRHNAETAGDGHEARRTTLQSTVDNTVRQANKGANEG